MSLSYGVFTPDTAAQLLAQIGAGSGGGVATLTGTRWYVDKTNGSSTYNGSAPDQAFATIAAGIAAAVAGDQIILAPGSYDEQVTITTSGITIIGAGNRGQVAVAPSGSNKVAITVTSASDVTLQNVGCEGDGTGGGLLVQGDSPRFRAYGCKLEGGAYAVKLLGNATASPADIRIVDCELCWATAGVSIDVSGGGDPVTQVLIEGNLFHNIVTAGVVNATAHTADIWVVGNVFAAQEDATETTKYLDIAVASTTGLVANNVFATTVLASSTLAIATGVFFLNNRTEREQPGTNAFATNGRPD